MLHSLNLPSSGIIIPTGYGEQRYYSKMRFVVHGCSPVYPGRKVRLITNDRYSRIPGTPCSMSDVAVVPEEFVVDKATYDTMHTKTVLFSELDPIV